MFLILNTHSRHKTLCAATEISLLHVVTRMRPFICKLGGLGRYQRQEKQLLNDYKSRRKMTKKMPMLRDSRRITRPGNLLNLLLLAINAQMAIVRLYRAGASAVVVDPHYPLEKPGPLDWTPQL